MTLLYIRIMKKVAFVLTSAFVGVLSFYGCGTGSNTSQKDSSLYLNDSIQIGDTAINLVGKGWLVPDPEYKDMYNLTDKKLGDVSFEKARAIVKDGLVNSFSYISKSYESKSEFQAFESKLFVSLSREYGKPTKDSLYVEKEEGARHFMRDYVLENKYRTVLVTINRSQWFMFGGDNEYSILAYVDIQDSIIKKKHLEHLFYKKIE